MKVKLLSRITFLATPWIAAYQAPPSMGFFQTRVLELGAIAVSNFNYQMEKKKKKKALLYLLVVSLMPYIKSFHTDFGSELLLLMLFF